MRFEWDEEKNRRNFAKHKLGFEIASLVFDDFWALSVMDCVVDEEERWQTTGMVSDTILLVAHTWRDSDGDELIRLISARKATKSEREAYARAKQRPD